MPGIIVGGGIAGLSAAIALGKNGVETRIYEAAPELKPLGAGIIMAVNAMQVFAKWGIDQQVAEAGVPMNSMGIYTEKLRPLSVADLAWAKDRYGYSNVAIQRGKLQEVLLRQLPEGIVIPGRRFSYASMTNTEEEEERVSAFFENKDADTAQFIIGADGLKSAVRKQLFPTSRLRYSGQTCWRGIVNMELPAKFKGAAVEAWGNKKRFGFLEVGGGKVYWYGVLSADDKGIDDRKEKMNMLKYLFRRFAQPVPQIIEQTLFEDVIRNDLYDLLTLPAWHKGPRCLVGDAAHAATPNMGQGGAQAVEDAWYLADEFAKGGSYDEIFTRFYTRRIQKVRYILRMSYSMGNFAHLPLMAIPIRNLMMMSMSQASVRKRAMKVFDLE